MVSPSLGLGWLGLGIVVELKLGNVDSILPFETILLSPFMCI